MANINHEYYFSHLYPLQDRVLSLISQVDTGFYLTGGTTASRKYLHHRFSDDLDFFANDEADFGLWSQRIIQSLNDRPDFAVDVLMAEDRFTRLIVTEADIVLKVEMVNDVPARVGESVIDPQLGRIDNAENILANKITALIGRNEPKDLADVWGFCCKQSLSIDEAIENAHSKAAGIFPADLARVLCSVTEFDWKLIRWIEPPQVEKFTSELYALGESLLLVE